MSGQSGQPFIPRRPLGRTGLEVSVLSFGGSPLGGVYSEIDEGVAAEAMKEAFRLGINFFDTSPYYGITKAETVMGKGLVHLPRDQIIVATKVGRYGVDTFDFSAERVTRSVHESLQRLQTSYIDLIQTHDIEFGDLDKVVSETIPALLKLKEQGLVRHIGITGLPLKVFPYVLDRVPPGSVDTVLSYCHYTPSDKSLQELLPYLHDKGVGVINASVLSMGLFTPQHGCVGVFGFNTVNSTLLHGADLSIATALGSAKRMGPPDWHPAPAQLKEAAAAAATAAASHGVSLPKLAIMEAVREPGIATHLVGLPTPEQVRENVSAVLQGLGLAPRPQQRAEEATAAEVERLLQPVQGLGWPSGRPENN